MGYVRCWRFLQGGAIALAVTGTFGCEGARREYTLSAAPAISGGASAGIDPADSSAVSSFGGASSSDEASGSELSTGITGLEPASAAGAERPAADPDAGNCGDGGSCESGHRDAAAACSGCLINGSCTTQGVLAPDNPCLICDPERDPFKWSNNDGVACDDEQFCTVGDFCQQGVCTGNQVRICEDGIACNGISSCDEDADACTARTNLCGQNAICDTTLGTCVTTCTGCVIDNNCLGNGAEQIGNPCMVCDTSRSTTAYVAAVSKPCGAGPASCSQQDTCNGSGTCARNDLAAGTPCGNGSASACDGADTCDGAGNCLSRSAANGVPCDDGQFCTLNDQCQGGRCVAGPSRNCGGGLTCSEATDACQCSGCQIGGTCFASAAVNPANACQLCDPVRSTNAFSTSTDPLCPAQGLVAYYPFNGSTVDASGQGNNCNATGATLASDRLGRNNRAFLFDGVDDNMTCGNAGSLQITGALSLAAWFSASPASLIGGNRNLVTKGIFAGGDATRAYTLFIQNQNQAAGGLCGPSHGAAFLISPSGLATANGIVCSASAIAANTWHHMVGVFQPNTRVAIYVDGAPVSENTTAIPSRIFNSGEPLVLGLNANTAYQGSLDEVRVYNRALTVAEISALQTGNQ